MARFTGTPYFAPYRTSGMGALAHQIQLAERTMRVYPPRPMGRAQALARQTRITVRPDPPTMETLDQTGKSGYQPL
jgi:hypothetical protein